MHLKFKKMPTPVCQDREYVSGGLAIITVLVISAYGHKLISNPLSAEGTWYKKKPKFDVKWEKINIKKNLN